MGLINSSQYDDNYFYINIFLPNLSWIKITFNKYKSLEELKRKIRKYSKLKSSQYYFFYKNQCFYNDQILIKDLENNCKLIICKYSI